MSGSYPITNVEGYEIDVARERLDVDFVHHYLALESYWARGLTRERLARSIDHAYCFGIYAPDGRQVGFARVTTDFARLANLGDVFVAQPHRGRGLGKWLVETLLADPKLEGVTWRLNTVDAHTLYERYGFQRVTSSNVMERPAGSPV